MYTNECFAKLQIFKIPNTIAAQEETKNVKDKKLFKVYISDL